MPLFTLVLSSEVFANWVGKHTNGKCKEERPNIGPNIHCCSRSLRSVCVHRGDASGCQALTMFGNVSLPSVLTPLQKIV